MTENKKQATKYTTIRIKTSTRERLRKEIQPELTLGDDIRITMALNANKK